MQDDLALACEAWRQQEVKESALLVIQDRDIQRVLTVWPMVGRQVVGMVAARAWSDLWACVEVDEVGLVQMAGLPSGRALAGFARAKAMRLIYPDGTLHKLGQAALQKLIKDAMQ